jgi:hypothetical protein
MYPDTSDKRKAINEPQKYLSMHSLINSTQGILISSEPHDGACARKHAGRRLGRVIRFAALPGEQFTCSLVHNIMATGYKVKHATASSTNRFCGGHLEAVRPTAVRVVGTRRRYVVRVAVCH